MIQWHNIGAFHVGSHRGESDRETLDRSAQVRPQKLLQAFAWHKTEPQAAEHSAHRIEIEEHGPVELFGGGFDLVHRHAGRVHRAHDRPCAGADHEVGPQPFALEHAQHADMRKAARRAAGQHQRDAPACALGWRDKAGFLEQFRRRDTLVAHRRRAADRQRRDDRRAQRSQ